MSVKRVGVIILICLFSVLTITPAVSLAVEGAAASAGASASAGTGATAGIGTLGLIGLGALGIVLIVVVADAIDDDDVYPVTPAHHGHGH